jgi:hypothetical protein
MDPENSVPDTGDTDLSADEAAMLAHLGMDDEDTPELPASDEPESADADDAADDQPDDSDVPDDSAPAPVADAPKKYKVKVRGEELEVEEPELLAGYSRTADYTRDKMAVAEEKRAIAAERQAYVQKLDAAEQLLAAQAVEPDWEQLRQTMTDDEFAATYAQWSVRQRNLEKVQAEKAREYAKLQQSWLEERQALAVAEQQRVVELIPEWKDPKKREQDHDTMVKFALKTGFTPEQLQNVFTAAEISVLHKAAQYDKLQQRVKTGKPVASAAPNTTRVAPSKPKAVPRVGPPPAQAQYQKDRAKLRQTGSLDDATNVFLHFIDD